MPRFFALHTLGPNIIDRKAVEDSALHAKAQKEITCYRSFINMTDGRAACLIDAPSQEWLANYFRSINLPFDALFEIQIESVDGTVCPPNDPLCYKPT